MYIINAINVNDALVQGIGIINDMAEESTSRAGDVVTLDKPNTTVYQYPYQRVLISQSRDANPFFHLMESIWMLAGRNDVSFLNEFNKNMINYSDDGVIFNAPYGYRLRKEVCGVAQDQIQNVVNILKQSPDSRQAVCQIWDPEDQTKITKDKACNMSLVFRIRNGALDMTCYNRSNDMVWGAYGANAVHLSMFQEYVAAKLTIPMGTYTQVSNDFHVYTSGPGGKVWDNINKEDDIDPNVYINFKNLVLMNPEQMGHFDHDINQFFNIYNMFGLKEIADNMYWESQYFRELVLPMLSVWLVHKSSGAEKALQFTNRIVADDWKLACDMWLQARVK